LSKGSGNIEINFAENSPEQKCICENEILAKLKKGEALQTTFSVFHICTATLAFFMDNAESSCHSIKIQKKSPAPIDRYNFQPTLVFAGQHI
jgi:hypothetical protein